MELQLSTSLTISKREGKYGKFVQLTRGKRTINLSEETWTTLVDNLDKVKTLKLQTIKLTSRLELSVVLFQNKTYVSFHKSNLWKGMLFNCYINLNEEEFTNLLLRVREVNDYFSNNVGVDTPDTEQPGYVEPQQSTSANRDVADSQQRLNKWFAPPYAAQHNDASNEQRLERQYSDTFNDQHHQLKRQYNGTSNESQPPFKRQHHIYHANGDVQNYKKPTELSIELNDCHAAD